MTGVCGRAPPVLCGATHGELALLRVSREQHCTSLDPHSMYCCDRSLEIGFLQIGLNGIPFWQSKSALLPTVLDTANTHD